jgi:NDP-sugar pyrophosphorylase family protein
MKYAIIAAGEGSRLVNEGVATPKPLVRLGGERMIDRLIRIFLANDAESVSIIVNYKTDEVYEHLWRLRLPVPLHLVRKNTPSSMHSFYELASTLEGGKFCLTTVDTVFREDEFAAYIRAFEQASTATDGLMAVTAYVDDEKPLYVATDPEMNIRDFCDESAPELRYVSGGIYCLGGNSLPLLASSVEAGMSGLRNYQRQLVRSGFKLEAWPFSKIIDVDHPGDIRKAEAFLGAIVK